MCHAKTINEQEQANAFLVEGWWFLLHDITDEKLFCKEQAENELDAFLKEIKLGKEVCLELFRIIHAVSFGSEFDERTALSIEQKVVRDADRLDCHRSSGNSPYFSLWGNKGQAIV